MIMVLKGEKTQHFEVEGVEGRVESLDFFWVLACFHLHSTSGKSKVHQKAKME